MILVDLKQVLISIPAFQNKNTLIPFYAAYEYPSKQNYMLSFWRGCFETVLHGYLKKVIFTKNEIKNCFMFEKFHPLCLDDMIVI